MRWLPIVLLTAILLLAPSPGKAGWGSGPCAAVVAPAPVLVASRPAWYPNPSTPGQLDLVLDNVRLGSFRSDFGYYRPIQDGVWGLPCEPPVPLPPGFPSGPKDDTTQTKPSCSDCKCGDDCLCGRGKPLCYSNCKCVLGSGRVIEGAVVENDGTLNFGLGKPEQLEKGKRILNGREVSREELFEAVAKGNKLPDDADQPFVTAIGDEGLTRKFLQDMESHPVLSKYKGKVRTNAFSPEDWQVKGMGFVAPSVYCQDASGKVLHRQDGYDDPMKLGQAIEKIVQANREPNKDYNSKADPDLTKPAIKLPASLQDVPGYVWACGAVLAYVLFTKKKEN